MLLSFVKLRNPPFKLKIFRPMFFLLKCAFCFVVIKNLFPFTVKLDFFLMCFIVACHMNDRIMIIARTWKLLTYFLGFILKPPEFSITNIKEVIG